MGNSLLSLAVLPVVLLLWFIYKKDPHPESRKILSKVFLFGCLTAVPVIICEILADIILESFEVEDTGDLFMYVFFGVGLIEEFFKWGVVKMLCFKNKEFDETYDAIVFAVFSSLGFACVENILYVLDGGIAVGIGRALLSVPGHACFGIVMGYYFGLAKKAQSEGRSSGGLQFMALLMPALLHTFYDFLLEMDTEYGLEKLLWLVFVIVMFIVCFVNVFSLSKKNVYLGATGGSVGGAGGAVWAQPSSVSQPIAADTTTQSGVVQTEARPVVAQQGQQGNMSQPINTDQTAVSGQTLAPVQPVQAAQPAQAVLQSTQLTRPVQPIQSVQPVQSVQPNQTAQAGQQVWQNWAPQPVQSVQQSVLTGSEAGVSSSVEMQPVLDQSVQQPGRGAQSGSSVQQ